MCSAAGICVVFNTNGKYMYVCRTTIQASNLAKSMCHEILKEEDDEVASLDEQQQLDDLLDEQNGNISEKLTNLSLNDKDDADSVAGLNGNNIANDSDRIGAAKNKKKTKKAANSINAAKVAAECDSNDNKLDSAANDELIKDVDVHA